MAKKTRAPETTAPSITLPTGTEPPRLDVVLVEISAVAVLNKHDRTRDEAFKAGIRELAANIAAVQLQQPIVVRRAKKPTDKPYVLVAGERRLLACQALGWTFIPASVLPENAQEADIRAAENLQRVDLNDDQKALVIGDLVADAEDLIAREQGVEPPGKMGSLSAPARDAIRKAAVARVAQRFGKPLQWVRDYAFLGELPKKVRELAAAGRLSLAHCKVLAAVVDDEECVRLAQAHAAGENQAEEPMGQLRDLQTEANRNLYSLAKVPWDPTVAFAGKAACVSCPDNSRNRTGLFDGRGKEMGARGERGCLTDIDFAKDAEECGVCLRMECFKAKAEACKNAIRSTGNRAAQASIEAKPKERGAAVAKLTQEANQKYSFVKPTVFRAQVQERVEAKLEKPKGGAKTGHSRPGGEDPHERAKVEAGYKLAEAIRARNGKLLEVWDKHVRTLGPADKALLVLAFKTPLAYQIDEGETAKEKRCTEMFTKLIDAALDQGSITGFDTIVRHLEKSVADDLLDWRARSNVPLVDFLAKKAGVKELPPVPVLADFLPKPKATAEPEKKSKTSPPAGTKGGKKPSGKKKAKKSKTSEPAAAIGPSKQTWDSVMESKDDRGAAERRQAAKEMAMDAAGEIDPQEEV